ncbi:Bifunctional inhibitor/lipid-transfer protein/seed storage 2S albumin superfamily protein [Abeliophyllum distichum]|uniref:Bifunctional inhibitor/lipid-transfer protein/seed storage 2S albumin superfamily protein n=1 Tax=Abeliophyllum distichum TaxID=126358 RepID=A0ABD1PSE1_9LAMI
MARKGAPVFCFVILMIVGCVSSDFAQDKKECANQLLSLSSCIGFVSGEVKAPTPSCCTELRKDMMNNMLCLCILVRDRNEPSLGFKLNATLALRLPSVCHVQSNATACPDLLHLAPNSPEAQVFEQFGSSPTAGDLNTSSSCKLSTFGRAAARILQWLVLSVFFRSI